MAQRRTIAPDDDRCRRTFANAVLEGERHALPQVAITLLATKPTITEPVIHCPVAGAVKAYFQFSTGLLRRRLRRGSSETARSLPRRAEVHGKVLLYRLADHG